MNFFQSDWFANVNGKFDLIVSNPPYICETNKIEPDLLFEPKEALFSKDNGLKDILKIINESREHLNPKGSIFLEHSPEQVSSIKDALENAQFKDIQYGLDLKGMARYTHAKDELIKRYYSQILLDELSIEKQELLSKKSITVIGCGGLGSPLAAYLAGAGVGKIKLVDDDTVELRNLHRQVF